MKSTKIFQRRSRAFSALFGAKQRILHSLERQIDLHSKILRKIVLALIDELPTDGPKKTLSEETQREIEELNKLFECESGEDEVQ